MSDDNQGNDTSAAEVLAANEILKKTTGQSIDPTGTLDQLAKDIGLSSFF